MALSPEVSNMNKTWRKFCLKESSRGLGGACRGDSVGNRACFTVLRNRVYIREPMDKQGIQFRTVTPVPS